MAFASSRFGAQEAIIKPCDLCEDEENVNWFCKDCDQNLCERCKRTHLKSNISKSHDVLSISIGFAIAKRNISNICGDHDEPFSFFCRTCDKNICSKCLSKEHKKHDFIDLRELQSLLEERLNNAVKEKEEQMKIMMENNDDLEQNEKEMETYVQDWCSSIDNQVRSITLATEVEGLRLKDSLYSAKKLHKDNLERNRHILLAKNNFFANEITLIRQESCLQTASSLGCFVEESLSKLKYLKPISFSIPNTAKCFSVGNVHQNKIREMIGNVDVKLESQIKGLAKTRHETKVHALSELNVIRTLKTNQLECYSMRSSKDGSIWIGCNGSVITIRADDSTILHQIPARMSFWSCRYIACFQSGDALVSYGGYPYVDKFTRDGSRVEFVDLSTILTYDIVITSVDEVVLNVNRKSIAIFSKEGKLLKQFEIDEGANTFCCDDDWNLIIQHRSLSNFSVLDLISGCCARWTFTVPMKDISCFTCDQNENILATNGKDIYFMHTNGKVINQFNLECDCINGLDVNHDDCLLILVKRHDDNSVVFTKYLK